jgi:hypothetical protein
MHAHDPELDLDDTSPQAREQLFARYRAMTPRQRLEQMCDMSRTARALIERDLRRRYPNADEHELRLRLFARWLDAPTMRRYYDWDPDREGL